jgi:hypothetical protein
LATYKFPIKEFGLAAAILAQTIIAQSNASKYGFADGGIVPGNSISGDKVPVNVNSREMILNQGQQKTLFDIANGKERGQSQSIIVNINGNIDSDARARELEDTLYSLSSNGRLNLRGVA